MVLALGTHVGAEELWPIFTLLGVMMNQNSSVIQIASWVPYALTIDTRKITTTDLSFLLLNGFV